MTYCCETLLVKREAYLASLEVFRLRTTRYERRTTFDQSRMSAQELLG